MSDNGPVPESTRAARAAAIMFEAGQRAKAEIDRATAQAIAEILGGDAPQAVQATSDPPVGTSPSGAAWTPDWGTIGQAERILMRSTDTTVKRVREEGLGTCRHGRWAVDLNRVRAWLDGRAFPPLDPYPQPDSVKFGKVR